MKYLRQFEELKDFRVNKIGVIGPGIVGMPMAAMLAYAGIKIGQEEPARVVVVQRDSPTSGWKVNAINDGKSVIGGIEPELDYYVRSTVEAGTLSASHDYRVLTDADVIIVCVQTDKKGYEPDYGPMFEALSDTAAALQKKEPGKKVVIIFESTLGPSSMESIIKPFFAAHGLIEGKDIFLGNSPNRVMPGRLVERIKNSDKIAAGLNPATPEIICQMYSKIVTGGELHKTNSLTAEIVKTFENAYRDVRIAYSSEIAEYCDENDIDFYKIRDRVNSKLNQEDHASFTPNEVPIGGLLIPMIGVGGHCLPKDGILLWWRKIENGDNVGKSLILTSRLVNNASPSASVKLAESKFGNISGKRVILLGAAYRFNSEDTRNSPSLSLAKILLEKNCSVVLHDPFVKKDDKNLAAAGLKDLFTNNLDEALFESEYIFLCTAHADYIENKGKILDSHTKLKGVFDGCNIYTHKDFRNTGITYTGIGRGQIEPPEELVNFVYEGFKLLEKGVSNELFKLVGFLNGKYAADDFNKADYKEIQKLAGSCTTGCKIVDPEIINSVSGKLNKISMLLRCLAETEVLIGEVN